MEFSAGLLVIAVVSEDSGFAVEEVRPVGIVHARRKDEHVQLTCYFSAFTKATLAIDAKQSGKRIVTCIAKPTTLITGVDVKIGRLKLVEWYGFQKRTFARFYFVESELFQPERTMAFAKLPSNSLWIISRDIYQLEPLRWDHFPIGEVQVIAIT
jgi:hypothetical protein